MFEEDNELDYEEEEVEEQEDDSNDNKEMKREEVKIWKKGGWKVDPRVQTIPGAHLTDPSVQLLNENSFIEYFLTFFPVEYAKDVFFFFFFNWYSLHARLNSHYEAWSCKKRKHKKVKAYRKSS